MSEMSKENVNILNNRRILMDYRDLIGKRGSVRAIPAEVFQANLPLFAEQLSQVDYHFSYSEEQLRKSWKKLCSYKNSDFFTASQTRPGIELCEHFFPNFFSIKNANGKGFSDYWKPQYLEKVITWNRSSHSTPYLSELRRGIYFCYGLTKNTMFRPHLAKMITEYYSAKTVLDPCCGWGGRLLGVVAAGAKYIGFEPNTETFQHLKELVSFLQIEDKVELYCEGAESIPSHGIESEMVLTSPPYYITEIYCDEASQSIHGKKTYEEWRDRWLWPVIEGALTTLIPNGASCWNVAPKMVDDVAAIHKQNGYGYDKIFGLHSSARQANQNLVHDKKTTDATICYKNLKIL